MVANNAIIAKNQLNSDAYLIILYNVIFQFENLKPKNQKYLNLIIKVEDTRHTLRVTKI
tara:strand:+ start:364 stop:540 length:177 start_codon:yes stop_codon:yes gene_type:complete